ncbi:MAG: PilW family protein [Wenzhouxiangellaceae bacterium]|nr:PilW family protein [Wenzhouxiangellaceae bacterium]
MAADRTSTPGKLTPCNSKPIQHHRATGFSLIELMIALTLGLLLTAGMVQLFSSTKSTFNTNEGFARVQENGRFAIETLKRELRPTGDTGFCGGDIRVRNHLNAACSDFTASILDRAPITGFEYAGSGSGDTLVLPGNLDPATVSNNDWASDSMTSLPADLAGLVAPGSDVLIMRTAEVLEEVTANGNTPANANSINLNKNHGLDPNEIVFITNCATGADLFQNVQGNTQGTSATSVAAGTASCSNPGPGNIGLNWSTSYDESMQIFRQRVRAFFIGLNANGEPGLFQRRLFVGGSTPPPEEIVAGVENMQVLYGFSNQGASGGDGQSVDAWVAADQIPDGGFGQVVAIRITLMLRSPDLADGDRSDQDFQMFSEDDFTFTLSTTGDGRIRQPFSTTIALRNQMLVVD